MQAVILAAGLSSRLQPAINGNPKCLVRLGEKTLLEHQVFNLKSCGVDQVIVVTGYCEEAVQRYAPSGCLFVNNPQYASTNSLYSLACAGPLINGPFILLNGDVFAHPEIYQRVALANGTVLSIDGTSGDDEEHMKVSVKNGLVRRISKSLPADLVSGENVGILKFCEEGASEVMSAAMQITKEDSGRKSWAPAAVDFIASRMAVGVIEVSDLPWVEIDFPADLTHAKQVVHPAIYGHADSLRTFI